MIAYKFYTRVTNSKKDLIQEFLQILIKEKIPYCVIGGIAVNAYCEPVVTLDFDCVVMAGRTEELKEELKKRKFKIKTHPHTWEIIHRASDVRIQLQRDERYQEFVKRAGPRRVLGYTMKVAQKEDILKSKIWAYSDSERDELKRDKDLLDIKRLIRRYPEMEKFLPERIIKRLKESGG